MSEIVLRPHVGVGVLVFNDGHILLGKRRGAHGSGCWSLPGGHLEFGEDVETCARRELAEETGLQAITTEIGPWTNDLIEADKHYVSLFVIVHAFSGELQLLEPQKCEEWQWFPWNELPRPLFMPLESLQKKVSLHQLGYAFAR